jgi:tetratricopeptide (TPR) repeat protein
LKAFKAGEYAKAETLFRQGLELCDGTGTQMEYTMVSMLALTLIRQSRFAEAEPLSRRAFQSAERLHGSGHAITRQEMVNFAAALSGCERNEEAVEIHRRLLSITEEICGAEAPEVIIALQTLGFTLCGMGEDVALFRVDKDNWKEVEGLYLRALALAEKSLAPDHDATLQVLNALGHLYVNMDEPVAGEAEKYCRRALEGRERLYGKEDMRTVEAAENLAKAVWKHGGESRRVEAAKMQQQTTDLVEKAAGIGHPKTLGRAQVLGMLLRDAGMLDEAEKVYTQMLDQQERGLGVDHNNTMFTAQCLAIVCHRAGKLERAEELYRRVLEWDIGRTGPALGVWSGECEALLVELLRGQGRNDEAESIISRSAEAKRSKEQPAAEGEATADK